VRPCVSAGSRGRLQDEFALVATLRDMVRKPRNHDTSGSRLLDTIALCRGTGVVFQKFRSLQLAGFVPGKNRVASDDLKGLEP